MNYDRLDSKWRRRYFFIIPVIFMFEIQNGGVNVDVFNIFIVGFKMGFV